MKLFSREYGQGYPLVILHGLFGSLDNWMTQAKLFSATYKVYAVDLRNHGLSPHSDTFDYPSMVDDLSEFFDHHQLTDAFLIGHSMGGKVAMNFALSQPDRVKKLIVVDISPRPYNLEHYDIITGLNAIPIERVSSRNNADEILAQYVSGIETRQFLLKNLRRKDEGFEWKMNLPVITKKLANIGVDIYVDATFDKPVLFVRGAYSTYIPDSDWPRISEIFPNALLETMETGHWVQAEQPKEFVSISLRWLSE
jgi:pimeloyl-ACP methyl ester carboxylesterase